MASKNSINKPKIKLYASSHSKSLARKRAARSRTATSTRSSTHRYADNTAPRPTESKALALYAGEGPKETGCVVNNSLSNKRAKKIARNAKYVAQRNQTEGAMEVEMESAEVKQSRLEKVKKALWSVVENQAALKVAPQGDGTTLGIQAF